MEPAAKVYFTRAEASEITLTSERFINQCLLHLGKNLKTELITADTLSFIQALRDELKRPLKERTEQMIEMYKGMTLEEIGLEMGVTRERVRQILKKMGVTGRQRQVEARKVTNQRVIAARTAGIEKRCRELYLCSFDEFKEATGEQKLRVTVPLVASYRYYRTQAIRHRINWEVTLPEFKVVIGDHLGMMRINRLCLVRKDNNLPFTVDNVKLTPLEESSRTTINRRFERQRRAHELYGKGWSIEAIATELRISPIRVSHYISYLEGNSNNERPVRPDAKEEPEVTEGQPYQHVSEASTREEKVA